MEDIMSSRRSMGSMSWDRKTTGSKETESVTSSSVSWKGSSGINRRNVFDGLSRKVGFKKKVRNDSVEGSQRTNETKINKVLSIIKCNY